jgi:hypothetical protein
MNAPVTMIYCPQCDRTYYLLAEGDDEVIKAAAAGDDQAAARLEQVRADWLTTHQMDEHPA